MAAPVESTPVKPRGAGADASLIWGASLAVHALILLLVGGWVVFQTGAPSRAVFEGEREWMEEEAVMAPPEEKPEDALPDIQEDLKEALDAGAESSADAGGGEGGPLIDGLLAVADMPLSAPPAFTVPPSALLESMNDIRGAAGLGSGGGQGKGPGGGRGGKKGSLFGMDMQTTNQGILVFLDNSGSMKEVAARVEALVAESFPEAKVVPIKGGLFANERTLNRLRRERGEQDYYYQYYSSMMDQSILVLVEKMLAGRSTMPESIYMLSDFADYVDERALGEFRDFLLQNKIKFYAHSVAKAPHEELAKLCKKTGGQVLVQAAETLPEGGASAGPDGER